MKRGLWREAFAARRAEIMHLVRRGNQSAGKMRTSLSGGKTSACNREVALNVSLHGISPKLWGQRVYARVVSVQPSADTRRGSPFPNGW